MLLSSWESPPRALTLPMAWSNPGNRWNVIQNRGISSKILAVPSVKLTQILEPYMGERGRVNVCDLKFSDYFWWIWSKFCHISDIFSSLFELKLPVPYFLLSLSCVRARERYLRRSLINQFIAGGTQSLPQHFSLNSTDSPEMVSNRTDDVIEVLGINLMRLKVLSKVKNRTM